MVCFLSLNIRFLSSAANLIWAYEICTSLRSVICIFQSIPTFFGTGVVLLISQQNKQHADNSGRCVECTQIPPTTALPY